MYLPLCVYLSEPEFPQAFAHAERAGLPFSERDAAWVTLRADIHTKLSSALTAANATRTSETVHGLAESRLAVWLTLL